MKALFAGSFDPFTIGHQAIVEHALNIFGHIVIGIGYNEKKPGEWSIAQRLNAIKDLYKNEPRVSVEAYSGLTSLFMKEIGAEVLLRGVRTVQDFEYERNLADVNRAAFGVETLIMFSLPEYSFVSSSMIRELIHNGFDPSKYIAGDFPLPDSLSDKYSNR